MDSKSHRLEERKPTLRDTVHKARSILVSLMLRAFGQEVLVSRELRSLVFSKRHLVLESYMLRGTRIKLTSDERMQRMRSVHAVLIQRQRFRQKKDM